VVRVLVIEDEPEMAALLARGLQAAGYDVDAAQNGIDAMGLALAEGYDLAVVDVMLPGMSGFELCRRLRESTPATSILLLTARDAVDDRVRGLDAGADDYLTKPFSTVELQARIRAQLRRARMGPVPGGDAPLVAGDVTIDLARRSVARHGEAVHLTPTEWGLLRALVMHAGRTLTHHQLFDAVWGRHHGDAQQYLRVYVANLRRKLEADSLRPALIVTEPGVGYRLELPEPAGADPR
jgi:DNA-binding response OmpR family regulator